RKRHAALVAGLEADRVSVESQGPFLYRRLRVSDKKDHLSGTGYKPRCRAAVVARQQAGGVHSPAGGGIEAAADHRVRSTVDALDRRRTKRRRTRAVS